MTREATRCRTCGKPCNAVPVPARIIDTGYRCWFCRELDYAAHRGYGAQTRIYTWKRWRGCMIMVRRRRPVNASRELARQERMSRAVIP